MPLLHTSGARAVARAVATIWAGYVAVAIVGYYTGIWRFERHHLESAWLVLTVLAGAAVALQSAHASPVGRPSEQDARRALPSAWLLLSASLIAVFVLYGGALSLGLFSDDFVLLARARGAPAPAHAEFFRPVPIVLWKAVASLTPAPDVWLHIINVALHGMNAMVVCLLARQWGLERAWAMAASALFLTFPASVEAVVWPSGIQDVLMTMAGLVAVWLTNRDGAVAGGGWFIGALTLLALLTKETAVAFVPLAAVLFASRWFQDRHRMSTGTEKAGRFALAAGSLIASVSVTGAYVGWRLSTATGPMSNLPEFSRLAVKDFIVRPFAALGSPWSAADLASWPLAGVFSGGLVVALVIAQLWRRADARGPIVSPLLWVLTAAAPVGAYFFVGPDLDGSRYLYLPSVGWAIWLAALSQSASRLAPGRTPLAVFCAGMLTLAVAVQAVGVSVHVGAWRAAAGERDRLLAEISSTAQRERCEAIAVDPAPDMVHGVYVFRNGLEEALRARGVGARLAAVGDVAERCRIGWRSPQP